MSAQVKNILNIFFKKTLIFFPNTFFLAWHWPEPLQPPPRPPGAAPEQHQDAPGRAHAGATPEQRQSRTRSRPRQAAPEQEPPPEPRSRTL
jgi:hypothetical protein